MHKEGGANGKKIYFDQGHNKRREGVYGKVSSGQADSLRRNMQINGPLTPSPWSISKGAVLWRKNVT